MDVCEWVCGCGRQVIEYIKMVMKCFKNYVGHSDV